MFQSADQQAIQNFHRSQKYPKYPKLYKCVALCGQVLLNKISSFYHKELENFKNFGLLLFAIKTFLTANWKKKYRNVFWLFWLGWPTLCYSCWANMANMACWENICLQNWRFLVVNTPATPHPPPGGGGGEGLLAQEPNGRCGCGSRRNERRNKTRTLEVRTELEDQKDF